MPLESPWDSRAQGFGSVFHGYSPSLQTYHSVYRNSAICPRGDLFRYLLCKNIEGGTVYRRLLTVFSDRSFAGRVKNDWVTQDAILVRF